MGKEEFNSYYKNIYGERWEALRESLMLPSEPVSYSEKLLKDYMLDKASIMAACLLPLEGVSANTDEPLILDACAAPGGKSLVIASRLPPLAKLLCNELSSERRRRLVNVLDEHLDAETRKRVTVSGFDLGKAGGRKSEHERFDAILLDAPCSSERHVIQSEKALAEWTPARPRSLAQRQWALLSAAFLLLKPGGTLVYSTCSINPNENDGVIARLYSKYSDQVEQPEPGEADEAGEKTLHGRIILPDSSGGMGPMYAARVRKKS